MGASSSQPTPSSQDNRLNLHTAKSAAASSLDKRAPRYTPTMDDEAASQQLMSEARAPPSADYEGPAIPLNLDGASYNTIANTPESGNRKTKKQKQKQKQLAPSQTSRRKTVRKSPPRTYSFTDSQAFVGPSPSKSQTFMPTTSSTQIEVPDTQTEAQANRVPSPTPLTSSQAAPTHASKQRSKKNKRSIQTEIDLNNSNTVPATPYEDPIEETMSTPLEATEGQASRKRRKKDKSRTSVNSVKSNPKEVSETLAGTQEVPLGVMAGRSDERNGLQSRDDQPLTPMTLLSELNAERSQKSQSAGKAPSPAVAHEGVQETELQNATETANAVRTPRTTQSARKKKRSKKDKKATETPTLDWEASVRSPDDTPAQPFTFEDSDGEGVSSRSKSANNKKASRYSIGGITRVPRVSRADPNKTYQRAHDDDDRTAADRALEKTHELGQPPDKRTSGEFTADEKELLRRAIRDYQERNGLDTADLVEIVQWKPGRKNEMGENKADQTEAQFKNDCDAFWDDVKSAGLLRKMKDIKKHVRVNYHMCQRGSWSQEEDEQLRELTNLHPGQWTLIATQLNRLELDCYNRWKDYVRHGENRMTKRWSTDEEENFVKVLSIVCQRVEDYYAETGQPTLEDYTPVINWHEVCRELGDTRSRLQCQAKWKKMRARVPPATLDVEIKPRRTPPQDEAHVKAKNSQENTKKNCRKSGAKKDRQSTVAVADLNPPGPEDMLWGDKFDLVASLIEQADANKTESDDQIVWQDIAERMNQTWSVRTLQTAYKQLCELVLDAGVGEDLISCLKSLLGFIRTNHFSEVEDRYQPAYDIEANGEDAPHANSSKKRKRQKGADSGKTSAKKRNKTTQSTAKAFKSRELITDSDNASSEAEL